RRRAARTRSRPEPATRLGSNRRIGPNPGDGVRARPRPSDADDPVPRLDALVDAVRQEPEPHGAEEPGAGDEALQSAGRPPRPLRVTGHGGTDHRHADDAEGDPAGREGEPADA